MTPSDVSPLELFFDLVFVFAVSQLAHHLYEHVSWSGAAQTAILLIAVVGVWAYVSFEATLLDVSRKATQWAVIMVMGLGLFLSAGISQAFDTRPWPFVITLLTIQAGQVIAPMISAPDKELRWHYVRALVWTFVSAPLWCWVASLSQMSGLPGGQPRPPWSWPAHGRLTRCPAGRCARTD